MQREGWAQVNNKRIGASLPLATVNGTSRLALCVEDLARRAHLRLSARVGGGRVQSIGGGVRGRGSEHGGTGLLRGWTRGLVAVCGCGRKERSGGGRCDQLGGGSSAEHSMGL